MLIEIILGVALLFLVLYGYITQHFGRWKKLGVPYAKGTFPIGSLNVFGSTHLDISSEKLHEEFKDEKYFGLFMFGKPFLNINDPEILKQIQVKDFDHFVDRTSAELNRKFFGGGELDQIWVRQLTSLSGEEWKDVRGAFTPIFTSGKMKNMMKFIHHVSKDLLNEFVKLSESKEEFELKSVFGKFSIDALASAAFGVDAESFTNKKSLFVKHAEAIFNTGGTMNQIWLGLRMIPGFTPLLELLKIDTNAPEATKFYRDIILQSIKLRRQTNERKNDLIDLMLDAMKDEKQDQDEAEDQYEKDMKLSHTRKKQISEFDIVATALVLLVAGYDTTGINLSFMAYELANNPDIQSNLQEEIDQAFDDAGDKFPDYNTIMSLEYLDMVIHETLRYHPPVGMNFRNAEKDWKLPNSDIILKKGDAVCFNARYLHKKPDCWSHPNEFYPEHFSKEEKSTRNQYAFQAFGQGPRACIGMRFSLLETKVAMMSVLRQFSFKPGTKTVTPLVMDSESELAYPKGGLWVNIERRNI